MDCLGVVAALQEAQRDCQVLIIPSVYEVHHSFQTHHPHLQVPLVWVQVVVAMRSLIHMLAAVYFDALALGDGRRLLHGDGLKDVIEDPFRLQLLYQLVPVQMTHLGVLSHRLLQLVKELMLFEVLLH